MAFSTMLRRLDHRIGAALLSLVFVAGCYAWHHDDVPADFFALYLAAANFGAGAIDQIYAAPNAFFDLSTPSGWDAQAEALGINARHLYPFIYPPLWAALFAPVTDLVSPATAAQIGYVVNPALLAASAWLAYRIVQPAMSLFAWQAIALGFLGFSTFGVIGLFQNQPQILVSFLILLALERDRSNAPLAAGAAMALAASIKLYPAVFALLWIATRNHRALGSFAGVGTALGISSIALAGWPLHAEFLTWIKTIANSLFTCTICFNVDATLSQYFFADHLRAQAADLAAGGTEVANVLFSVKPDGIQLLDRVLLLTVIAFGFLALARAEPDMRFRRLWPSIIIAVSFVSPLTWTYHYLTVVVFLPLLLETMGRAGKWHLAALFLIFSFPTLIALERVNAGFLLPQILGSLGIGYMLILFLRPRRQDLLLAQPLSA